MDYDAYDALLHYIFKRTQEEAWFKPSEENVSAGVCLRVSTGVFRVFPYENHYLAPFEEAVRSLNPVVAVKIRSAAVHTVLSRVPETVDFVQLDAYTQIQVLETMAHLPTADKEQQGAFIRDERVLITWTDDLDHIVPLCKEFEDKLIKLVWRSRAPARSSLSASTVPQSETSSATGSAINLGEKAPPMEAVDEKAEEALADRDLPELEKGKSDRPQRLFAPVYGGLAAALSMFYCGNGAMILAEEVLLDGNYIRLALLVTLPFLFCVSLFFSQSIVQNITMVIGPVAQYHENSKYYSAIPCPPNKEVDLKLPHVTIEMPVYKESLSETIAPSVYSLKKAMQTYARQGGSSSIFIHDDGLQLISPEERLARTTFYGDHNIGFVARPAHDNAPDGFKRSGPVQEGI